MMNGMQLLCRCGELTYYFKLLIGCEEHSSRWNERDPAGI